LAHDIVQSVTIADGKRVRPFEDLPGRVHHDRAEAP
jgi:hypothetical protein